MAQGGIAEINGVVLDQSQAVLPGVTVVVTNVGTSAARDVVTGPDGRFIVPTLTPGVYSVSVELPGFQSQVRDNVDLRVGQEVTLSFTLAVGGLAENLTVTGQAPVVEVTTNRVATQISTAEIDSLPSQGRNQLALMALVPGLTPSLQPGGFQMGEFTANGRDRGSNTFLIDGMSNQQALRGGALGGQARMALDAMAEYQVLTHQYAAEYGGLSGVVVNSVSRSGTNAFRGRAFTYFQDDKLNAVEHFAKLAGQKNPDSGNKVLGGSIGGPIVRDRAFFFVNYERNMFDEAVSLTFPPEAAPLAVAYTDTAINRTHNTFFRGDFLATRNHTSQRAVPPGSRLGDWRQLAGESQPPGKRRVRTQRRRPHLQHRLVVGHRQPGDQRDEGGPDHPGHCRGRGCVLRRRCAPGLRATPRRGSSTSPGATSSTSARGTHTPITTPARPPGTAPRSRITTRGTTRSRWSDPGWVAITRSRPGAGYFRGLCGAKDHGRQFRGVVRVPHESAVRSGERPDLPVAVLHPVGLHLHVRQGPPLVFLRAGSMADRQPHAEPGAAVGLSDADAEHEGRARAARGLRVGPAWATRGR